MNRTTLRLDTAKNSGNIHSFRVLLTSDIAGHNFDDRLDITSPSAADGSLADVLQSNIADNFSDIVQGTGTDWGFADNTTVDLSGSAYQGITSATFRICGFAINAPTSSTNDILRFDNVIVEGSLVTEPSVAWLAAMAGLVFAARRRHR